MKRITVIFLALALQLVAALPVLDGIRLAEGVRDPAKSGPAGELGWHRITRAVWVQHTSQPFALAGTNAARECEVAQQHLDWLERNLVAQHGPVVSPYWLALAWNAGLSATLHHRTTAAQRDYAQRVQNLCQETTQSHP